jgi:hypothetical protein
MKFFNVDLHISIIADMIKIFGDLGHEITEWSLSNHTWVFNKQRSNIPMLDNGKWTKITPQQYSDEFYSTYKDKLSDYDAFIVTYPPPFALLYKHFNKPIIINNPIRYEWPFSFRKNDWEYFNDYLKDGVDTGKIILVANNLHDKKYMEDFIGREVQHIPSICDYYGDYYNPTKEEFIYYSKGEMPEINSNLIVHKDKIFKTHKHSDLTKFKGIIHFPYQISYMSIFEQYTANIPLFVPTKDFLIELYKNKKPGILKEMSWNSDYNNQSKSFIEYKKPHDPNDYLNVDSVYHWLQYADFYDTNWMPHIIQFNSFEHLKELVDTTDTNDVSNKMKLFNSKRKSLIYNMWDNLIKTKIQ